MLTSQNQVNEKLKDKNLLFQYGNQAFAQKNYALAYQYYQQIILLDPLHYHAHLNTGNTLSYLGRFLAAIDYYNKAIALDKENSAAFYNRGFAYKRLNKFAEAIADFSTAIALNTNINANTNVNAHEAYINRGAVLMKQKEFAKAKDDFTDAMLLNPTSWQAYYNRGLVNKELGLEEAFVADMFSAKKLKEI